MLRYVSLFIIIGFCTAQGMEEREDGTRNAHDTAMPYATREEVGSSLRRAFGENYIPNLILAVPIVDNINRIIEFLETNTQIQIPEQIIALIESNIQNPTHVFEVLDAREADTQNLEQPLGQLETSWLELESNKKYLETIIDWLKRNTSRVTIDRTIEPQELQQYGTKLQLAAIQVKWRKITKLISQGKIPDETTQFVPIPPLELLKGLAAADQEWLGQKNKLTLEEIKQNVKVAEEFVSREWNTILIYSQDRSRGILGSSRSSYMDSLTLPKL